MLMNMEPREVASYGARESNTFSIQANGKAFKVLIDGLYSDKIRAVVRELWSNAYDSHIDAGCPEKPFYCKLPTLWAPEFSVRDYGTSLSHAGVMSLYTTVFASSKEGSNTTVGKLGLGSKSPFAYSDVFTVTAWMDGTKRLYSAYIGADYVPRIDFLGEELSDEPQGLEVSFPVKMGDVADFTLAAQRCANGFEVTPDCNIQITKTTANVLFSGDGWKLYKTTDYGHGAHARQGCVIYPLDPDAIVGLTDTARSLLKAAIYIDFPIGDLEIAASRESLGYDKRTCANIVSRLAVIEKEVMDHFHAKFAAVKTAWDALNFYNEMKSTALPEAILRIVSKMSFRGREVSRGLMIPHRAFGRGLTQYQINWRRGSNRLDAGGTSYSFVRPGEFVVYTVGKDEKVGQMEARILAHQNANSSGYSRIKKIFVLRADEGSKDWTRAVVMFGRMPTDQWVRLADLPKPMAGAVGVKRPVKAKQFDYRGDVSECEVDLSAGGYYVPMERKEVMDGARTSSGREVVALVTALKAVGALAATDTVYGIPATLKRAYTNKDNGWINLFDLTRETVAANSDKLALIGRLSDLDELFNGDRTFKLRTVIKKMTQMPTRPALVNGRFAGLFRAEAKLHDEREKLRAAALGDYRKLFEVANVTPPVTPLPNVYATAEHKIANERYPMIGLLLTHVSEWSINDVHIKGIVQYVNTVDAK